MRIAHWCATFSALSETFIYDQVLELERQGTENHVLTYERENEIERPFERVRVLKKEARYHVLRTSYRLRAAASLVRGAERAAAYWPAPASAERALREIRPDVIHAHFGHRAASIAPLAEQLSVPLVVSFYGYDATALARRRAWQKRYARLFEQADLLLGVSDHICRALLDLGAPLTKVVQHNIGICLDRFPFRPPEDTAPAAPVRCLHAGRLVEKKSPVRLVESFAHARSKLGDGGPDLHLTLAGGGPQRDDAERTIARHGLEDQVELLGDVSSERVAKVMREAHLYTQHSVTAADGDQEGLGITFLEAAATGLPTVATRHGGVPHAVQDGKTGRLVEEHNTEAMGDAIADLATDPEQRRRMGRAGRERVEQEFDLTQQTWQLRKLYDRAVRSQPARTVGLNAGSSPASNGRTDSASEREPERNAFAISTVIIAQDEEERIASAVESCHAFAEEVLVVDGGSIDATPERAEEAGARVVHNDWPGYAEQRNVGAAEAKHDWIFMLDADEVVGERLQQALGDVKRSVPPCNAFSVLRVGDFFGQWLWEHAERHVRLYNKQRFQIKDVPVHEAPDVGNAPVGALQGTLWHYGFRDVEDIVERFNHYTTLDAEKAHQAGRRFSPLRLLFRPQARVLYTYFFEGMWKKGMAGAGVTIMWLLYEALKELKLYEIERHKRGATHEPAVEPDDLPRSPELVRVSEEA